MTHKREILAARGGFPADTYRTGGLGVCARKIASAIKMYLPLMTIKRRTNSSVGAYFDLITDDARMFYGDNFHFGYFRTGAESFEEALNNHTDIVCEVAGIENAKNVLDLGCGICAPAIRIAKKHNCRITGLNISKEQVRQGKALVASHNLSDKIGVIQGNALALDFADCSFDTVLCIEVAGDICVKKEQKDKLAKEIFRVLKPGGSAGFSDLVFTGRPSEEEEKAMRTILYHDGAELITDWPGIFEHNGFVIKKKKDIINDTMKTWDHSLAIYESRSDEVEQRYGKRIANNTMDYLRILPDVMRKYGSFVVMSAQKPL